MKTSLGSYSIYRQPKQRPPGLPQFEWKWVVRFFVGEDKPMTRSKHPFPICDKCLAEAGNPVQTRANCGCQKAVRQWAEAFLQTHTVLLQRAELDRLAELRAVPSWTPVSEVLAVYRERGPDDRAQRLNFLATVYEQATGSDIKCLRWEDLTADLKLDWAELRQEAGRRGWLGSGGGRNMPADGWRILRDLKRAGTLPALDDRTEAAWNTSINTYMMSINSIFGDKSRTKILRGLRVPPLESFLGCRMALPGPKGHKEIPSNVMARIDAALPLLRAEDAQVWLFEQLAEETGMRPVSVRRLVPEDLQALTPEQAAEWRTRMAAEWRVDESELSDFGGLVRVAAAKHGAAVLTPVSRAVVDLALELEVPGSLIGARSEAEARALHARLNAWLRGCGVTGTHAAYLLRHRKGQLLRRWGGKAATAAGLGHTSEAMAGRYSREDRVVPAVGLRVA
jgi:integrase